MPDIVVAPKCMKSATRLQSQNEQMRCQRSRDMFTGVEWSPETRMASTDLAKCEEVPHVYVVDYVEQDVLRETDEHPPNV